MLCILCRPILDYFKFAPPPFERILMEVKSFELCGKVSEWFLVELSQEESVLVFYPESLISSLSKPNKV